MFQKSLPITLLVIILTPLSFIVAKFIASRSYLLFGKQNKTRGQESAYIDEMITNLRLVKVFGYEDRATSRFKKINDELGDYATKATFYSSLTNPCTRAGNTNTRISPNGKISGLHQLSIFFHKILKQQVSG